LATAGHKDPGALKTIGELSQELGVAQHILRYWETKFPQLRPMQRAGNRRYYRPSDVDLVRRINRWLNHEGYTVRGVQKLLRDKSTPEAEPQPEPRVEPAGDPPASIANNGEDEDAPVGIDVFRLIALRNRLADALDR
jgi:DNA-binding transcriptional MerR regulator